MCKFAFNSGRNHLLTPLASHHYETSTRDFFLVPITQVYDFLNFVSEETGICKNLLDVPEKQLVFRIDSEGVHSPPVLLGTSSSKKHFDDMVEEFGWKKEDVAARKANDKKKRARKRNEKRHLALMTWTAQVRTARQHLGLGNRACHTEEDPNYQPSPDRERPVLVAIDIEAWEKDQNFITEIGISTLDTANIPPASKLTRLTTAELDLETIDIDNRPETRANEICKLIEYRHIRIKEHKHMRNGQFVNDCADKFDFGTSEWVSKVDAPATMGESLRFFDEAKNRRKVILVGHDPQQDFAYLRVLGYDVWNIKDLEVVDTGTMYKAVFGLQESRSLGKVLGDLGLLTWNLHNAGNDAAYTLQAFVHLADKGVPPKSNKKTGNDLPDVAEPTVIKPTPVLEDDMYAEYEDLVEAGCIKYVDPSKETLGPRPPKEKKKPVHKETPKSDQDWLSSSGWD